MCVKPVLGETTFGELTDSGIPSTTSTPITFVDDDNDE
jgi:hypothetical protein